MSRFQEFCYLVVQRHKANNKRRRLLYRLNKKLDEKKVKHKYHIRDEYAKDERSAYRNHANNMTKIANEVYSPLRRELGIVCRYTANNSIRYLTYQGEYYSWQAIQNHANSYLFETVVLSDNQTVNDTYKDLV